jgi:hypothetical protein
MNIALYGLVRWYGRSRLMALNLPRPPVVHDGRAAKVKQRE